MGKGSITTVAGGVGVAVSGLFGLVAVAVSVGWGVIGVHIAGVAVGVGVSG